MAQMLNARTVMPQASPLRATCAASHKQAGCTVRQSARVSRSQVRSHSNGSTQASDHDQEAAPSRQEERFVSVSDLLAEVSFWS